MQGTAGETEAQRSEIICPRPCRRPVAVLDAGVSDSAACTTVAVMPSIASNDELSTVMKIKCTKCVFSKSVCCHGALIY